jgi:hypothetical protein
VDVISERHGLSKGLLTPGELDRLMAAGGGIWKSTDPALQKKDDNTPQN